MKKILFALAALAIGVSASAKTADELRVYINPGHGSWTGNDRPMPLVGHGEWSATNTDTLNFFESNTNLRKCFGVLEKLREYGLKYDPTLNQTNELEHRVGAALDLSNNIVMSHVKCGPYLEDNTSFGSYPEGEAPYNLQYYNRNLYDVAQEVETNHFDMFISIHSNAASEGTSTNYLLFMYRGKNNKENVAVPGSWEMSEAAGPYAYANAHEVWTVKEVYIQGDVDWMGSGTAVPDKDGNFPGQLTVLKHSVPGYLVEGYFHTYQPSRHRAMNWDVDYMEGAAYAHGFADYWGLEKEKTGDVYGIVRDANQKFTHQYYKPNPTSQDRFMPLNGMKVLLKKDGEQVAEYTTDNYYNGAFVFKNLEPGTYTVTIESDEYLAPETEEVVEVKAATTNYTALKVSHKDYVPSSEIYTDYPDELKDGFTPKADYTFEQSYVDQAIDVLAGKTIRRTVAYGNNVYVLALDAEKNPTIVVLDGRNGSVLANVSTEGMTTEKGTSTAKDERLLVCSDIQVSADGYLLATNLAGTTFSGSSSGVTVFKWEKDEQGLPTGAPEAWLKQNDGLGNWNNCYAGETFCYQGTIDEGNAFVSAETAGDTKWVRISRLSVIEGALAAHTFSKPSKDGASVHIASHGLGDGYRFHLSPFASDAIVITGPGETTVMSEYAFIDGGDAFNAEYNELPEGLVDTSINNVNFFKYAGAVYAAVPAVAEGANAGVMLLDVTKGIANATVVATVNTELPAAEGLCAVTGQTILVKEEGALIGGDIDLVVVRGNGAVSNLTAKGEYKSGVNDILGEVDENAPAVYFNLQGIEVPAENLGTGIYVKVQGSKATKVLVK